jgi:hypothetical protein
LVNHEIYPVAAVKPNVFVDDGKRNLATVGYSIPREPEAKTFLVSRFQVSRDDLTTDLYRLEPPLGAVGGLRGEIL